MTIQGLATKDATAAFAAKHASALAPDAFSDARGLRVSSIGLGTYLGDEGAPTDRAYEEAIALALGSGVNHLDTAVNYRGMASERALGRALAAAVKSGLAREQVLVATKGGYVPEDVHAPRAEGAVASLVRAKKLSKDEVVRGIHCLAPAFIETMLATSLKNMDLAAVDVYYLHNPETQLSSGVAKDVFYARCRAAFEVLEAARRAGHVGAYGTATWNGYRRPLGAKDALELERMVESAGAVGGDDHGFRWVQLPVNLGATEAVAQKTQSVRGEPCTLLDAARKLGVEVVASGSIAQAELAAGLPSRAERVAWPKTATTAAQRALLFVRSCGVATALVGMSKAAHVRENVAALKAPRLAADVVKALVG